MDGREDGQEREQQNGQEEQMSTTLEDYRTLGRTGLRVSPFGLGAMTFGAEADDATASDIFHRYLNAGGNFVDTADLYAGGGSERCLGKLIRTSKARDSVVISTKFSFSMQRGNPNGGGNGRAHIMRAVEASLARLDTDYIDLYILHAWDRTTPVEEVIVTLNDLVRSGKVRHIGMSDVPAWYASRAQTLAETLRYEPLAVLQLEYSLCSRSLEREHVPLAADTGISIVPWSPLASGFLTGKYQRNDGQLSGLGRVSAARGSGNPTLEKFGVDDQSWNILAALKTASEQIGATPTEVALAWVLRRPQVTSVLVGATTTAQLETNLAALSIDLPEAQYNELTAVSRPVSNELDLFFEPVMQAMVHGGATVRRGVTHAAQ